MVFQSGPSSGALICAGWRLLLSMLCAGALTACSSLLIYYPSDKYDNKVVRGVVTHIATKEEMAENWERRRSGVENLPSKVDFVDNYQRVTVAIEKGVGHGVFVYPFVPKGENIEIGDLVDVSLATGSSRLFQSRLEVSRLICKRSDTSCFNTHEGARRGVISSVK